MGVNENLANKAEKRTEAGPLTVKCPKCGAVNLKEAMNCRGCGINLKWATEHPEEEWQRQAAPVPAAPAFDEYVENEIKKHATGALINAIISIFFFGIVLGPLAFQRANKAIRLIREHKIGQEHEGKARAAQIIAIIGLCIWVLICVIQFGQR